MSENYVPDWNDPQSVLVYADWLEERGDARAATLRAGHWRDSVIQMVGVTMESVTKVDGTDGDELVFKSTDGRTYRLYHSQSCCESVGIEDICGDLNDLVGSPILVAEVNSSENQNPEGVKVPEYQDSFTWTFYKFATVKGYVDVRWYGSSNGYYSESVDFAVTQTT